MNHSKTIDFLYQLSSLGWKLGLNKIRALLKEIGNPHEKFKVIHIAGTNGKGSTSAIIESILRTAGYHTGLFTSPHLIQITERIKINGNEIDFDDLEYYIKQLRPFIERYKCTFFEAVTAIAFAYFADRQIDVAVIEVGLGGRLDATNVVTPVLSIITDIEHDHTKQLGRSRKKIAYEKGGIIKPGAACLTMSQHKAVIETLAKICDDRKTELIQVARLVNLENVLQNDKFTSFDLRVNGAIYPQLKLPLLGEHQLKNASLAVTAANFLNQNGFQIKIEDIYHGLFDVRWPGRMQFLEFSPRFIVDVAHNPDGMANLVKSIQKLFSYHKLIVIIGIVKHKNYHAMVRWVSTIADLIIAVRPETPRSIDSTKIKNEALLYKIPVVSFDNVKNGMEYALSKAIGDDLIVGTGSHYTVGELISLYKNR